MAHSSSDFFRGVVYEGSFPGVDRCPSSRNFPVVVFTGRSNSGKSSLLSALADHKHLAHVSRTAGKTRTLNYFKVPTGKEEGFYLVDLPGYGFARISDGERKRIRIMVDTYLARAENLRLIVVVLDARRKLGEEEKSIIAYCNDTGMRFVLARTKWDTMNAKERDKAKGLWKSEGVYEYSIPISSTKKTGLAPLLLTIREAVREEE